MHRSKSREILALRVRRYSKKNIEQHRSDITNLTPNLLRPSVRVSSALHTADIQL